MRTREEAIEFCLTFAGAYEDYPFDDSNWTLMRHRINRRAFACIFERENAIWINVKCDPMQAEFWRGAYSSIRPAYHMNKQHWNSIILDGTVPEPMICGMIEDSYALTGPHNRTI